MVFPCSRTLGTSNLHDKYQLQIYPSVLVFARELLVFKRLQIVLVLCQMIVALHGNYRLFYSLNHSGKYFSGDEVFQMQRTRREILKHVEDRDNGVRVKATWMQDVGDDRKLVGKKWECERLVTSFVTR
ncbi:hypothetical protein ACMFMG_000039 [Clarireedia jacksonii]